MVVVNLTTEEFDETALTIIYVLLIISMVVISYKFMLSVMHTDEKETND